MSSSRTSATVTGIGSPPLLDPLFRPRAGPGRGCTGGMLHGEVPASPERASRAHPTYPPCSSAHTTRSEIMTLILTDVSDGRQQRFSSDRVCIGRHPSCDVVFNSAAYPSVSARHAEITRECGRYVVRDLDSRNGTFVNGEMIPGSVHLHEADVVQFGKGGPALRLSIAAATPPTRGVLDPQQASVGASLVVEHVAGARTGMVETVSGDVISFGRAPGCHVRFDPEKDETASSRHAEIRREAKELVIYDLGSSNGTYVNGERVERRQVRPGDLIEFGWGGPQLRLQAPVANAPRASGATAAASAAAREPVVPVKQGPGAQTVQGWIENAVEKARQNPSTRVIEAAVGEATRRSRRTTRIYAAGLVALVVVATGGALAKVRMDQKAMRTEFFAHVGGVQETLKTQLAATQRSMAGIEQKMAQAATKDELGQLTLSMEIERQRANQLHKQIAATQSRIAQVDANAAEAARGFRAVAESARDGVYMLAIHYPDYEESQGFCSAFAVRPDGLLYTNAHCNEAISSMLEAAEERGLAAVPVAIRNGDANAALEIVDRGTHPGYAGDDIDLAYLRVRTANPLPAVLQMASPEELESIGPGYELAVFGYPGEIMDPRDPAATFFPGTVGRFAAGGAHIQHSCLTSGGTSGSPMLNKKGQVVGINHAGIQTNIMTVDTDQHGNVRMNPNGALAMRPLGIPRAGLGYGVHGRYLAAWLPTLR